MRGLTLNGITVLLNPITNNLRNKNNVHEVYLLQYNT